MKYCLIRGVYGHVYGENPFASCDYPCIPTLKKLLGEFDRLVKNHSFVFLTVQVLKIMKWV